MEGKRLIARSAELKAALELAKEVARSDVTVLIEGESGTGKELFARLIHEESGRRQKPFIFVNCAALTESLVEAQLFGHAKGAFTGAVSDQPGRFHLADGGTLFLDEIGDLGAKGQGSLLRVLEDGAFRRVGGTRLELVDVRVIAATNKNLLEAVAAGKFREDLYYRLQVVPLLVPPLRRRSEDIPILVESFLEEFCTKHGKARKTMAAEALTRCRTFEWPGNVRQLRNLIERVVVTCPKTVVQLEDLPPLSKLPGTAALQATSLSGLTLIEAEKLLIRDTLKQCSSHRASAAARLGISRRALHYKLQRYGMVDL